MKLALTAPLLLALSTGTALASATCPVNPSATVKHVVFITFDNLHNERDRALVPSDLEQLPALRGYLLNNGVLATNDHAMVISHTANDILNELTGLYPDRMGSGVSNSFGWYPSTAGTSTQGAARFTSTFTYWVDPVNTVTTGTPSDAAPIMLDSNGKNTPAPWVSFTKANCDVGYYSVANTVLENNGSDIINVFGASSPENQEPSSQRTFDFVGVAVHCAQSNSPFCGAAGTLSAGVTKVSADTLPDQPNGGYTGQAVFGQKYVAPVVNAITSGNANTSTTLTATASGAVSAIDNGATSGFAGFSPNAAQSLTVVARMLEAGIPVVHAYIADAHDDHNNNSFGPGENAYTSVGGSLVTSGYEDQLARYNTAFAQFFSRLSAEGITPANTVFVITTDEQDHYAGGTPNPSNCNGTSIRCTWTHAVANTPTLVNGLPNNVGEVALDMAKIVTTVTGNTNTFFDVHSDVAPNFYLRAGANSPWGTVGGQTIQVTAGGTTYNANIGPTQTDASVRGLEHFLYTNSYYDPYARKTVPLAVALADQAEMNMLHMLSADPQRQPQLTMFGQASQFDSNSSFGATQTPCSAQPTVPGNTCVQLNQGFAWVHGGIANEVTQTWVGLVGPGILNKGLDSTTWSEHADFRPTILALAGISGTAVDYVHDGRILSEHLSPSVLPAAIAANKAAFEKLCQTLKQLNAPYGTVSKASLKYATPYIGGTDNTAYATYVSKLNAYRASRDALATTIKAYIDAAEFHGGPFDAATANGYVTQAQTLINRMVTGAL